MDFGTILTKACIALLSGYLSLSGALAHSLERQFVQFGIIEKPVVLAEAVQSQSQSDAEGVASENPIEIPSHYISHGLIPRILLDNLEYQQAAVAGAGTARANTSTLAASIEEALVNIFCAYRDGDTIRATTGSGIFIDSKGIILTNAHVAQFLLIGEFKDKAKCTIRQGNPAEPRYLADLLYISPAWVYENAKLIDAKAPAGTGERDYALLYVTEAVNGTKPETFPSLAIDTSLFTEASRGTTVIASGYPADTFGTDGPRAALRPRAAAATLTQLFTFKSGEADLMAISSSTVGEQGSSGGPVISKDGKVIGLIVTKGDETKDGTHSLRALTLSYISRTIKEETGFDLETTLEGNIARRSQIFKQALVPFLASLLKDELQ